MPSRIISLVRDARLRAPNEAQQPPDLRGLRSSEAVPSLHAYARGRCTVAKSDVPRPGDRHLRIAKRAVGIPGEAIGRTAAASCRAPVRSPVRAFDVEPDMGAEGRTRPARDPSRRNVPAERDATATSRPSVALAPGRVVASSGHLDLGRDEGAARSRTTWHVDAAVCLL